MKKKILVEVGIDVSNNRSTYCGGECRYLCDASFCGLAICDLFATKLFCVDDYQARCPACLAAKEVKAQ
jgi:hypothetical protein